MAAGDDEVNQPYTRGSYSIRILLSILSIVICIALLHRPTWELTKFGCNSIVGLSLCVLMALPSLLLMSATAYCSHGSIRPSKRRSETLSKKSVQNNALDGKKVQELKQKIAAIKPRDGSLVKEVQKALEQGHLPNL